MAELAWLNWHLLDAPVDKQRSESETPSVIVNDTSSCNFSLNALPFLASSFPD